MAHICYADATYIDFHRRLHASARTLSIKLLNHKWILNPLLSDYHYKKLRLCRGLFIGPSAMKIFAKSRVGTAVLTALQPLPRVGPSAGWDPRHNQDFAKSHPSARSAPTPSHLGCRPLCRRLRRETVGTDAPCDDRPLQGSQQRHWPGFTPVDWPLPRTSWGHRQSTCLCGQPTLGIGTFTKASTRLSAKK
jgi:hypothetical protein